MTLDDLFGYFGLIAVFLVAFIIFWMTFGFIVAVVLCSILAITYALTYYCRLYKLHSPIGTCPSCHETLFLHHREITLSFPPKVRKYGICPKCGVIIEIKERDKV